MKEYTYFNVIGGKVLEQINKWNANRTIQQQARLDFMKEFKASGTYGSRTSLHGLVFDGKDKPPVGWIKERGTSSVWKPGGPSKEAKAIRQRMRNLPMYDLQRLTDDIVGPKKGGHMAFMEGLSIRYMVLDKIGNTTILMVPKIEKQKDWMPPDNMCIPLKNSEYWAMKEMNEKPAKKKSKAKA